MCVTQQVQDQLRTLFAEVTDKQQTSVGHPEGKDTCLKEKAVFAET